MAGKEGTAPTGFTAGWGYPYFNLANHCFDYIDGTGTDQGCMGMLAKAQNWTGANTFSGGLINTTKVIDDQTIGMTTSAMSAQSTATLTAITNMSWTLVASKNYSLGCEIPVTFAASATIAFGLVGPGTPTSYNIDAYGLIGAAAVYGDFNLVGQTTWVSTKTELRAHPARQRKLFT